MSGYVLFNNGITYATGGPQVLNGLITAAIDESNLQATEMNIDKMNFSPTQALNPGQLFSGRAGLVELDVVSEGSVLPEMDVTKLDDKGFQIVQYGNKIQITDLMNRWLEVNKRLVGADSSVIQYFDRFFNLTQDLIKSAQMNLEMEMMRLWTFGLDPISSAFGPGSPTPKLKPLFSQSHPVVNGTRTFANVAPTNVVFSTVNLQLALDLLKKTLLENGYYHKNPNEPYKLYVSRILATTARQVLNDVGQLVQFTGTGTNSNQANTFRFKGNMVEIVELDWLGQTDKNGNMIGTDTYWFVQNPSFIKETNTFKIIKLQDPMMSTYVVNDTKNRVVDLVFKFAVDHYGAEAGIFGSKGDGTASNA